MKITEEMFNKFIEQGKRLTEMETKVSIMQRLLWKEENEATKRFIKYSDDEPEIRGSIETSIIEELFELKSSGMAWNLVYRELEKRAKEGESNER